MGQHLDTLPCCVSICCATIARQLAAGARNGCEGEGDGEDEGEGSLDSIQQGHRSIAFSPKSNQDSLPFSLSPPKDDRPSYGVCASILRKDLSMVAPFVNPSERCIKISDG